MASQRGHAHAGAQEFVPDTGDLAAASRAVQECRGCDLYRDATQAVFGRGARHARVLLLGEQPGDSEDRQGEPFVGPAGRLLHKALEEAAIPERDVYLTNAVKHFRWRPEPHGGKRRIHQRPDAGQVAACRPWWLTEVRLVAPEVIVALGATAGQALFGSSFRVGASRGKVRDWEVPDDQGDRDEQSKADATSVPVVATIHPSAVLRAPERDEMFAGLVEDLRAVSRLLG
ncbi:MAG TPA: UdgX family uracil-DNA binding protein [Actinospica sp.]|jgi:DNA polymerase|nr:UdgX family uracil-DNA binding protein [Actinospica sp.]